MTTESVNLPNSQSALRTVKLLVGSYLGLSALTLVAIVLLRNNTEAVNTAVWIRGTIVVLSAALMTTFVAGTARGARRAFLRLRIVSAVMVVAIVAIISIPGTFPVWMKIEQAVCGLLLIGVVLIVNGRHLRSQFAAR
ncbi:hypothetical protein [Solihabitans fulvus]|nr:hypothetical protein [Solihabitans fulvus]